MKHISVKDAAWDAFVSDGKRKIKAFYDKNCETIIAKSLKKAEAEHYDEALHDLSQIPPCAKCHGESASKLVEVYKAKMRKEGRVLNQTDAEIQNRALKTGWSYKKPSK